MHNLLKQAISLAKEAGREVMKIYAKDFTPQEKEDGSPITEGDLASEAVILTGLKKTAFAILSEETKADEAWFKKDKVWIVDPLDGTSDFIQKTGQFSVMVGLVENKRPVLGIVYQPTEDKLYFAEKGKGAFVQVSANAPRRLRVSDVSDFKTARVILSRNHTSFEQKEFVKKMDFGSIEHIGSIGVKAGVIAEGKAEVYFTETDKTHQWDTAAPEIIIKEAGGVVFSLKGEPLVYCRAQTNNPNGILICNKALYPKMLQALKQFF